MPLSIEAPEKPCFLPRLSIDSRLDAMPLQPSGLRHIAWNRNKAQHRPHPLRTLGHCLLESGLGWCRLGPCFGGFLHKMAFRPRQQLFAFAAAALTGEHLLPVWLTLWHMLFGKMVHGLAFEPLKL